MREVGGEEREGGREGGRRGDDWEEGQRAIKKFSV